jgi:hypothetical protein
MLLADALVGLFCANFYEDLTFEVMIHDVSLLRILAWFFVVYLCRYIFAACG